MDFEFLFYISMYDIFVMNVDNVQEIYFNITYKQSCLKCKPFEEKIMNFILSFDN